MERREESQGNSGMLARAAENDRMLLRGAKEKGRVATVGAFIRLSGPGWLQSAITLGGGSLAGSLYLGILGGFSMLWLQPLAMILGIVMLSAIGYVTLSTGQRPFRTINEHVNPVLGWGWAIAALMANVVWALPQFSLATAAIRQNLLPGLAGSDAASALWSKLGIGIVICIICITITWCYDRGSRGIKVFEIILKAMVAIVVLSFFGVVVKMSLVDKGLNFGQIIRGFIPDLSLLSSPAKTFMQYISAVEPGFQQFWTDKIVGQQRDVMISATATSVGINMTFLLPYSMLKKGWDKEFRNLAIFDLATGLLIPFVLATSCVVVASATQFHVQPATGILEAATGKIDAAEVPRGLLNQYYKIAAARVKYEVGDSILAQISPEERDKLIREKIDNLPDADKRMAAMLVKRDAFNLAQSLAPLTSETFSHYIFGIGVVGMGVSTIIILMTINGFVVCEMLGVESKGFVYRLGTVIPALGVLAPLIWTGGKAQFWLAVPTSVFGMTLLPIAYIAFFLLMNQKRVLGDNIPIGGKRLIWNVLMTAALGLAGLGSLWSLWSKLKYVGLVVFAGFTLLVVVGHFLRPPAKQTN